VCAQDNTYELLCLLCVFVMPGLAMMYGPRDVKNAEKEPSGYIMVHTHTHMRICIILLSCHSHKHTRTHTHTHCLSLSLPTQSFFLNFGILVGSHIALLMRYLNVGTPR